MASEKRLLPNKCIQTINAKEAHQEVGAKIINMAFANVEEAVAA